MLEQALPTCRGSSTETAPAEKQTVIWREDDEVCIRIRRRKNRPGGSGVLRRRCCCQGTVELCPVHTLWDRFFKHLPCGAEPWRHISANAAIEKLRAVLRRLGIPDAGLYGTHDFRRGHAEVREIVLIHFP